MRAQSRLSWPGLAPTETNTRSLNQPYAKNWPLLGWFQPLRPPRLSCEPPGAHGPNPDTSAIPWLLNARPRVLVASVFTNRRSYSSKVNIPRPHSPVAWPLGGTRYISVQRPKLSPNAPPVKSPRREVGLGMMGFQVVAPGVLLRDANTLW